ncbi:MAG: 4-hydroxy-tetrahydrodipicolinate reductase [Lachnospiraceae bacterium]|nr:4-hydroxy-tetrahydrodipicolinate reductase [Lachnospiraceae bacterium]
MTKAIIHGAGGQMGRVIAEMAASDPNIEIVAGIDVVDDGSHSFPVYTASADCSEEADVVIDFSVAKAVDGLLDFCERRKLPVVLCTTGLSEYQLQAVSDLSKKVAILRSANMSLGINTLFSLVKKAAAVFGTAGFDIEIVEKHHNKKMDAPSGTAIALADAMNEALDNRFHYTYDRSGRRERRDPVEIGISAVRGGNIVGEHEVIFAGTDEVITLTHQATSRGVFGKGAIEAAKFLAGKPAGMYDMLDVIGD